MSDEVPNYDRENAVATLKHLTHSMDAAVISLTKLSRSSKEAAVHAKELSGALEMVKQWIGELDK